VDCFAC
jgi:hypothetical protein